MSGLPDPDLVAASAARLAQYAATVREHATRLAAAAVTCRWDGPAARAFRREADEVTGRLLNSARRLEDAAAALRRHAAQARAELDELGHEARGLAGTIGAGR